VPNAGSDPQAHKDAAWETTWETTTKSIFGIHGLVGGEVMFLRRKDVALKLRASASNICNLTK
jgi:hypothetical protein